MANATSGGGMIRSHPADIQVLKMFSTLVITCVSRGEL